MTQITPPTPNGFVKYPKIHRLGSDETEGILETSGLVWVQEKIDGANVSIWRENGKLRLASRNRILDGTQGFNGFIEYATTHNGIKSLLESHPEWRLYGEWLVRHTINYEPQNFGHFYLFDVLDHDGGDFLTPEEVEKIARGFEIRSPQIFAVFVGGQIDCARDLEPYIGKSSLGEVGEGIVLKAPGFLNKFGVRAYAKIVSPQFKEDNALTFGNTSKKAEDYVELGLVSEYMTPARVTKAIHKIESALERALGITDTARVINTAYHDMITEEAWEIAKKKRTVNFAKLMKLATKKASLLFQDVLNQAPLSVAHV